MKFKPLYTNQTHMYSVGIDEETNGYVIEVTIPYIGVYSLYFTLTDEEVATFKQDEQALTRLARELAVDKGKKFFSKRLIQP